MDNVILNEYDYRTIESVKLQDHIKACVDGTLWIKENYINVPIESYLDIPGWVNDAQTIFKKAVDESEDDDILVEIGTYFGQSACLMGSLIKNSNKKLKFDTFDTYEQLDPSMRAGFHPQQFIDYRFGNLNNTAPFSEIVKMHLSVCNVEKFVNVIVCDAKHSHHFYKDETIKMFYIDGINNENDLLDIFINIWPKIKKNGFISGDDIGFTDVKNAINKFCIEFDYPFENIEITDLSYFIRK